MSSRQRHPSPGPYGTAGRKTQLDGLSSQTFLSGAGVQAALGGLAYTVNGRALPAQGIPYHTSIFNSPKAVAGGRTNSEPPTPTSGQGNGRQTPQRTSPNLGTLGSPKVGAGYNYNSTPTRKGSGSSLGGPLASTAPAGSLAGISRLIDGRGSGGPSGGVAAALGGAGARGGNLSATMPVTGSRPPTGSLSGGPGGPLTATSRPASGTPLARPNNSVPGLLYSVGSNQSMGARGYQEDYRAVVDTASTPGAANLPNVLLGAAVYDGHGGKQVSHWLASSYCLLDRAMVAVQSLMASGGSPNDVANVLDDVFVSCGSAAIAGRMTAGSCVAMALLVQGQGIPWVLSANVGDSRTVLVAWEDDGAGGQGRPEVAQLSIDHKLGPAKLSEETRRVQAAGGTVIQLFGTWRIDGSLAVARAIGDCEFGKYVSYHPTVSCRQLQRRDRWLIIASDGLWDVMTNDEVGLFCKANHQLSAAKLAEALVREAVRNRSSGDNTTVVAVRLQYSPPGGSNNGNSSGQ